MWSPQLQIEKILYFKIGHFIAINPTQKKSLLMTHSFIHFFIKERKCLF